METTTKEQNMNITKIEAGEYKVCEATLSWNEYSTYTGEIRIYKYPADGEFGNWGVVFEWEDENGIKGIANTERDEFFFTLRGAKEFFANGGEVETYGLDGRLGLTQI